MSNLINTLPPLHDVAKLAGLNLPEYLGNVEGESEAEEGSETTPVFEKAPKK